MKTSRIDSILLVGVAGTLCALLMVSCGRSDLGFEDLDGVYGQGGSGGQPGDGGPDGRTDARPDAPDAPPDAPPDHWVDGGPCDVDQDCNDGEYCTMDRCIGGTCYYAPKDLDDDQFVDEVCGGVDCNDSNPNVHPGLTEDCTDGSDNDCNGVTDCFDPACAFSAGCGCVPDPAGENCGNGKDDDCNGQVDCNDPACIGTVACGCAVSEVGLCQNGIDDDCDLIFDCEDSDCFNDPGCKCASIQEDCTNGADDNCNFLVDCADPQCAGHWACNCVAPGIPEVCTDDTDNDCDKLVDCADPDCFAAPACEICSPEVCNDGIDNDCDNYVDCADDACLFDPTCTPVAEICNNDIDDDLDTLIDCADPDCKGNPMCVIAQDSCFNPKLIVASGTFTGNTTGHTNFESGTCGGEAGEAVFYFVLNAPTKVHADTKGTDFDSTLYIRKGSCPHGKEMACDDDSGGAWAAQLDIPILYPGTYFLFVDGYTVDSQGGANEGPFVLNVVLTPNPPEICDNGKDDDGDVFVDCADSDCTFVDPCTNCNGGSPPRPEFAPDACTDGQDNDCDGETDCSDSDCHASDYYVTECCNGQDDNGNMITDDFACRCAVDGHCNFDEICYTHTSHACGPRCDNFFGDVCPFVAPGSYCSTATGQCEFP